MNKATLNKISKLSNIDLVAISIFQSKFIKMKKMTPPKDQWHIFKIAIYNMCPDVSSSSTIGLAEATDYINTTVKNLSKNSYVEINEETLKERINDGTIRAKITEDGEDTLGRVKRQYEIYERDLYNFGILLSIPGVQEHLGNLKNGELPGGSSVVRAFYISSKYNREGLSRLDSYAQAAILLIEESKALEHLQMAIEEVRKNTK
jgi:hypothetical protein